MSRRYLLLILAVSVNVLVSLFLTGCGGGSTKPPAVGPVPGVSSTPSAGSTTTAPAAPTAAIPQPATTPPSVPPVDVAKTEPVIKLAVEEFLASALKDPLGTDAKYEGKVIQLQGDVMSLTRRVAKGGVVGVSLGLSPSASYDYVICTVSDLDAWKNVAKGSQITIKGRWAAFDHLPGTKNPKPRLGTLKDCVILEATPCPRISVTADQLAEDYSTLGYEGFNAKYLPHDLLVEGEVESFGMSSIGAECVIFKTASPIHIGFHPRQGQKSDPSKMKGRFPIGQKVAFIGKTNTALTTPKMDTIFIEDIDVIVDE